MPYSDSRRSIIVVGSGFHFVSGISYYTHRLSCALAARYDVGVVLIRDVIPARFYPGRDRVGTNLTSAAYPESIEVVDGVSWYWGPGLIRACRMIREARPEVLILQWWTGAVLHTYLLLALLARICGSRVIIEFHEVQDTGEVAVPGAAKYVNVLGRRLTSLVSGSVIHSEDDRAAVCATYGVDDRPIQVIPHGPFTQYAGGRAERPGPTDAFNFLYFGTIRPYKGLEDLVAAFNQLSSDEAAHLWLTVVGETWEGWTLPSEMIASSPHRDRITFLNRYVTDDEAAGYLAGADAVVLPYHRSSASGPLHVAMSCGLPVIVTSVGGLPEAAGGYDGVTWVPPRDPQAIARALRTVSQQKGRRFADPHSWDTTVARYEALFELVRR